MAAPKDLASRENSKTSKIAEAIIDFLRANGPSAESTIHDSVRGRKQTKVHALRNLVDEGRIAREGSGSRAGTFLYMVADVTKTEDSDILRSEEENTISSAESEALSSEVDMAEEDIQEVVAAIQMLIKFREQRKLSAQQDKIELDTDGTRGSDRIREA